MERIIYTDETIALELRHLFGYSGLQAEGLVAFYRKSGRLCDLVDLIEAKKSAAP